MQAQTALKQTNVANAQQVNRLRQDRNRLIQSLNLRERELGEPYRLLYQIALWKGPKEW